MKIRPNPPGQINHPPELEAPTTTHPDSIPLNTNAAATTPPRLTIP